MNKVLVILILPLLLISYPKNTNAEFKKNKIAVLDFMLQGKGFETEDLGQIVAEWLITALVKQGRFDVVERRLLKKIIAEQQLSETGLLDQETTAKLGKVLGVKVVVSGSVMRLQDIIEVNSRIIDVESGSILAAESVKNEDASRLKNLVEEMAQKIINAFPLEGYVVNRQIDRVTIDLGRTSGVKPGMKFIVYKEGEVIKHPKTGEVLDVQKIQTGIIDIYKVLDNLSEGSITKETEPDAIMYGQLVKSFSKNLVATSHSRDVKVERRVHTIKIQEGALFINTVPSDALVRILNIKPKYYRGINLAPGSYHIEVKAPSHQTQTQWVNILPGENKSVDIALIKLEVKKEMQAKVDQERQTPPTKETSQSETEDNQAQEGALFVNTVPADAFVRILNIKPKYYQGISLPPGRYHIEVKAPSHQKQTQWVNILPGENTSVTIALTKLEDRKVKQKKSVANATVKTARRKPSSSQYKVAIFPSNTIRNRDDWCYKVHDQIKTAAIGVVKENPVIELKYSQLKKVGNLNKKGLEQWWAKTSFFGTHKPHMPTVTKYAKKVGAELVLMYDYGWEYYIGDYKPFYVYLIDTKTNEIFDASETVDIDIAPLKVKELTNRVVEDFMK